MRGKTVALIVYTDESQRTRYVHPVLSDRFMTFKSRANIHLHYRAQALLVGFEDERGRFEVRKEVGDGIDRLLAQFPSIRLSDERTSYRFGDPNEFFLFRMLWETP